MKRDSFGAFSDFPRPDSNEVVERPSMESAELQRCRGELDDFIARNNEMKDMHDELYNKRFGQSTPSEAFATFATTERCGRRPTSWIT